MSEIQQYRNLLKQIPSDGGIVSFIIDGYWNWTVKTPRMESIRPLKFDIKPSGTLTYDIESLGTDEQKLAKQAMELWSSVSGIDFKPVNKQESDKVDITFSDNYYKHPSGVPYTGAVPSYVNSNGNIVPARVNVTIGDSKPADENDYYPLHLYIHEIGHALGLGHPGPYSSVVTFENSAKYDLDVWNLSAMSYFYQDENPNVSELFDYATPVTPGILDVIAIQNIYGKMDVNAGDTTYGINSNTGTYLDELFKKITKNTFFLDENAPAIALTIVDTGGIDKLDFRNDVNDQSFMLNLHDDMGIVSAYGYKGNIIVKGNIENISAGRGNDYISGNFADNIIFGNVGNDRIYGREGDDILIGGAGNDALVSGTGNDTLIGSSGNDKLYSQKGSDVLEGGTGNDTFIFYPEEIITFDTIIDFTIGEDVIDLRQFETIQSVADIEHYYFSENDESNSYLDLTEYNGGYIILEGVNSTLSDESFLFAEPEMMVA